MNKAALYLRLSKEDIDKMQKGDESESIINQRLLLIDYAIQHDFQVVDVYADDNYSGLYDDRPEFERLIQDSKLGKFNVVLAKTQSRFTRNMEHVERYLHHDFPLLGIRFIGVVDGVDTNIKANKKARQINGLVNEWYCEDLSENIRTVYKQKMKAGQYLGAFAPYGYLKDPSDNHKFVVDPYAAKVVKKIFTLYIKGYSIKRICHHLEDQCILNPTTYKKKQGLNYVNAKAEHFSVKYNLWSETTVKRILRNETYLGSLIQGTCQRASYKDKKIVSVPKEEWIVIENHHAPIIEKDLFEKVQQMSSQRRIEGSHTLGDKKTHMLAGKMKCCTCGSTMIKSGGVRGSNKDWYLRCQLANKSRLKECTSHNIRYAVIEKIITDHIDYLSAEVLKEPGHFDNLLALIKDKSLIKQNLREKKQKLNEQNDLRNYTAKSIKQLYEDRLKGILAEDMFFQLKEDFEHDHSNSIREICRLTEEIKKIETSSDSDEEMEKLVYQYCNYKKLTHELVFDFVDSIEIGEKDPDGDQEIVIYWNV